VVIKEKDQAIRDTATIAGGGTIGLYTDASVAKRLASIAVVQETGIVTQVIRRDSIGWVSTYGLLKPTAPVLERVREAAGVIRLINRDRSDDPNPFDTTRLPGQYT
jgi:hypothetical protein